MSKQTFHSETCREVPLHSKDAVSFNPHRPQLESMMMRVMVVMGDGHGWRGGRVWLVGSGLRRSKKSRRRNLWGLSGLREEGFVWPTHWEGLFHLEQLLIQRRKAKFKLLFKEHWCVRDENKEYKKGISQKWVQHVAWAFFFESQNPAPCDPECFQARNSGHSLHCKSTYEIAGRPYCYRPQVTLSKS